MDAFIHGVVRSNFPSLADRWMQILRSEMTEKPAQVILERGGFFSLCTGPYPVRARVCLCVVVLCVVCCVLCVCCFLCVVCVCVCVCVWCVRVRWFVACCSWQGIGTRR